MKRHINYILSTASELPTFSFRPHKKRSPWLSYGGKKKIGRGILENYKSTIIYWNYYKFKIKLLEI